MLKIYFFGKLHFTLNGEPFHLQARRSITLLFIYLALFAETAIPRATLAELLYADSRQEPRTRLRKNLHRLRTLLPTGTRWLIEENQMVQWNSAAAYWCDVHAFESLRRDPATRVEALALYTGDLLEGFEEPWIQEKRAQLKQQLLRGLDELTAQARAQHRLAQARSYAALALNHDPYNEILLRELMLLDLENQNRASALNVYKQFQARLRRDGAEPMPETVALYEQILRNETAHRVSTLRQSYKDRATRATRTRMHPDDLAFFGRERELQKLAERWERARAGEGGIFLVSGEGGIGKSRLLAELEHNLRAQGTRVLNGSTQSPERVSYQPFVEAFRSALVYLAQLRSEPQALAALTVLVPEIRQRHPKLPSLSKLDTARERTRLFDSFTRVVLALARAQPLLILLEDLHRAGADTIALLEWLAPNLNQEPVLIIGTYREEDAPRTAPLRSWRARVEKKSVPETLALERLDKEPVFEMAAALGYSTNVANALYQMSEGVPLYIAETLREWTENGASNLGEMDSAIRTSAPQRVGQRSARLSSPAQTFLETAAVLGDMFSFEAVRDTLGWQESRALDALNELLDHQWIGEALEPTHGNYAFNHHLIRTSLYEKIPAAQRTRRHDRAARVLQDMYQSRLNEWAAEIARHYDAGGNAARAVPFYERAAQASRAVFADRDALEHLSRALELSHEPRKRFELGLQREELYSRLGERDKQKDELDVLRALTQELNEDDAHCTVLERRLLYHRALGERDLERETIETFAAHAKASQLDLWQTRAQRHRAEFEMTVSNFEEALAQAQHALAQFSAHGDHRGQIECYCLMAQIAAHRGQEQSVYELLERARALARDNQSLVLQTLRAASIVAHEHGEYRTARAFANEMLTLARAIGDREAEADAHWKLGNAENRLFLVEDATRDYTRALELFERLNKRQGRGAILIGWSSFSIRLGRFQETLQHARAAFEIFQALQDVRGMGAALSNLAYAQYYLGESAAARAATEQILALTENNALKAIRANGLVMQGWVERQSGNFTRAIELIQQGIELRRSIRAKNDLVTDLRDLALTYLASGDTVSARATVQEMRAGYQEIEADTSEAPTILWAAALVFRACGETETALAHLEQAQRMLSAQADGIPDEDVRTTFLQIPEHRAIQRAYFEKIWT